MDNVMDMVKAFFGNYMLTSAILGWLFAQTIKIFTNLFVKRKFDIRMFFSNGGMPSSHSSTVVALSFSAAIRYGLGSPAFAIAAVLSMIVMNDAFGVRWQAGQQAQIINKMIMEFFSNKDGFDVKLKEIIGHTPLQVLMGAILGAVIAIVYGVILHSACGMPIGLW